MKHELDPELARWLRVRTTLRARRGRNASALDDVSMALRKVRTTLVEMTASEGAVSSNVITRTYRWVIRVARELEGIEQLDLDALTEWMHFEAFAPFALAFFESAVAPAFARSTTVASAGLRRDVDAVLVSLTMARASSALAA